MGFNSVLELNNEKGIAKITLSGELDASVAPQFRNDVEKAAAAKVKRLVLLMQDLEYMASAGLRALVFAKQKMGSSTDIYVIGAQESVLETLELTRFNQSVILLDQYDAAQIESL
jgi:anti-anti-sigma factor